MDLFQAMRIYAAVASEGSMTAAGRRLRLSKALVSRTVADLEERLNVRLLNRTTRSISLTEAGERYLEHCQEILDRNADVECRLAEVSRTVSGVLRINAPVSYGATVAAPLIAEFAAAHPGVRVELTLTDRFVDLVEEAVDVAVRVGDTLPETAIARRIGEARRLLLAAPALVAARGAPESLADLADWPRLVYPARPGPEALAQRGLPTPVAVCNNGDALAEMAAQGLGYAYLPDFIAREALESGRLVPLLPERCEETIPIHALWPHRRRLSFKTRAFIDHLAAALRPRS